MQNPSDDMLMALADDQLDRPEALALRQRIETDPALAARFAVFADSRAALQSAFAAGDTPDWLAASIRSTPPGDPAPRGTVVPFRQGWPGIRTTALAASVLLAVGVGGFRAGQTLPAPTPTTDPGVLAAVTLANAATGGQTALAGGGTARILGSYETTQGLCRLIDLALPSGRAERAILCRDPARDWVVIAAIAAGQSEAYIPASDTAAEVIDRVLDDLGAGPPLDPAAEAEALAR